MKRNCDSPALAATGSKSRGEGVTRRSVLRSTIGATSFGVAGCLGRSDEPEPAEETDPTWDSLPPDQREAVEIWIETVEGELSMKGWRMAGGEFVPRYYSGNAHSEDTPILAEGYTAMVEAGFEYDTMPTAFDEDDIIDYMLRIRREWTMEHLAGELSEDEYFARIEATVH